MISLREIPFEKHSKFLDVANLVLSNLAPSPRKHQRRPSSLDQVKTRAFMNVDDEHDLGLENLLNRELNQKSLSPRVYVHKLNECFHSEDLYQ